MSFEHDLERLRKNDAALTSLNLQSKNLHAEGARSLSEALKINTTLISLDLSWNHLREEWACHLAEALKTNATLTSLNLTCNHLSEEGARSLSEALKINTTLISLDLSWNHLREEWACHLAEALKTNATLTSLNLTCNHLSEEGARSLSDALKINTTLTKLVLGDSYHVTTEGACFIAEALKINTALTSLNLTCNRLSEEGARSLSEALKTNTTLTSLNLNNNKLWREIYLIGRALITNTTLTSLYLSSNYLQSEEARQLAGVLKTNATLTKLDLSWNLLGEEAVHSLSEALKTNFTLTSLELSHNNLGDEAVRHLAEALKTNFTLTSLELNHNKVTAKGALHLAQALTINTALISLNLYGNKLTKEGTRHLLELLVANITLTTLGILNLKKVFNWFLNTAESGDANAQCTLGSLYQMGRGTQKNEAEAFEWYQKAAAQGDVVAQQKIVAQFHRGCLYLQGLPEQNTLTAAIACFKTIACFRDSTLNATIEETPLQPVAILTLAFLYQTGFVGLSADANEAQIWLKQLEKVNLEDGILKHTLEQLIIFRTDGFFYALLGFFHEYNSPTNSNELLNASTYYKKAVECADLAAFSAQIALKRVESAIKAHRFQQLIAQQALQQRQQMVYQEQDQALQAQILSVSELDELDALFDALTRSGLSDALKARNLKRYKQLMSILTCCEYVRTLLQQRTYAYPVVMSGVQKYYQRQPPSLLKGFKPLPPLITTEERLAYFWQHIVPTQYRALTRLLKLKFLSKEQKGVLSQLSLFLDNAQKYNANLPPPVLIHESAQGTRVLKPEFAARLLPEGELVSDTERGSHPVVILNGVHYKCAADEGMMPIAPGIEYMVDRLNKLLAGHGSAPTTLIKVTQRERAIIYQASKTVTGVDLQYILEKKPEYLAYLDKNNFSAMTILGILTNPQDGKADNYMVEIDAEHDEHGKERIKALHIVGIDNDLAFGSAVEHFRFQDGIEKFATQVRNVLFLFPQMEAPLGVEFREQFLMRSPEHLLIEWLQALAQRNAGYEQLLAQGVFTPVDFNGACKDDKGLQLPIMLPIGLVRDIYRKLVKLQDYVRQFPAASHQELLAYVEPIVAQEYKWARDNFSDLIEGVYHMYQASLGEDLKSRLVNALDDFHTVASRLIYESAPKLTRELKIAEAMEELILVIDWSEFGEDQQNMLVQAFSTISLSAPTELLHQLIVQQKITRVLLDGLLEKGAHLNAVPDLRGYNALHTAVRTYSLELVTLLLEHGAQINARDEANETPLDKVLKEFSPEKEQVPHLTLIELLLAHGAQASVSYQPILSETLEKIKATCVVESSNIIQLSSPPPHLQLLSPPPVPRHSMPGEQLQHFFG